MTRIDQNTACETIWFGVFCVFEMPMRRPTLRAAERNAWLKAECL